MQFGRKFDVEIFVHNTQIKTRTQTKNSSVTFLLVQKSQNFWLGRGQSLKEKEYLSRIGRPVFGANYSSSYPG